MALRPGSGTLCLGTEVGARHFSMISWFEQQRAGPRQKDSLETSHSRHQKKKVASKSSKKPYTFLILIARCLIRRTAKAYHSDLLPTVRYTSPGSPRKAGVPFMFPPKGKKWLPHLVSLWSFPCLSTSRSGGTISQKLGDILSKFIRAI